MILLAEDKNYLRDIIKSLLEHAGHKVITACDGLEAVKLYQQHQDEIKLVVFDVMMPHLSGPEASEHVRAINPQLPLIFITGFDKNGALKKMKISNNFKILTKPTCLGILSETICDMLDANPDYS